ncbi:acyl-CoA N-acyltransferase [Artemisia annua]|uniref:Acyl-CoA N-acyltransferase n=1 Tax=Artemisia annua TaxID=35608 RepID=A0A2U1MRQ2_ARTAN|nr:acyl-CoA N-acyltransferase [Artemisia annua]
MELLEQHFHADSVTKDAQESKILQKALNCGLWTKEYFQCSVGEAIIVGEIELVVNHYLLGLPGVIIEELTHVLRGPQVKFEVYYCSYRRKLLELSEFFYKIFAKLHALEQCEIMLNKLGIVKVSTEHTAGAAQLISLTIMEECFVPMVDTRTEYVRLNYEGYYTMVLEKDGILLCVASLSLDMYPLHIPGLDILKLPFRIHDATVAKMPVDIGAKECVGAS